MFVDSCVICEYFEEIVEKNLMINGIVVNCVEICWLVVLFDENFYGDVIVFLLYECMKKWLVVCQLFDLCVLCEVMKLVYEYFYYIDYLIDYCFWLVGVMMSFVDFVVVVQILVVDYFGGIDWLVYEQLCGWYLVFKSWFSFWFLLFEWMEVIQLFSYYVDVNV